MIICNFKFIRCFGRYPSVPCFDYNASFYVPGSTLPQHLPMNVSFVVNETFFFHKTGCATSSSVCLTRHSARYRGICSTLLSLDQPGVQIRWKCNTHLEARLTEPLPLLQDIMDDDLMLSRLRLLTAHFNLSFHKWGPTIG